MGFALFTEDLARSGLGPPPLASDPQMAQVNAENADTGMHGPASAMFIQKEMNQKLELATWEIEYIDHL